MNEEVSLQLQRTNNNNSLKRAPDLVGILEQGVCGHICSPLEAIGQAIGIICMQIIMYKMRVSQQKPDLFGHLQKFFYFLSIICSVQGMDYQSFSFCGE